MRPRHSTRIQPFSVSDGRASATMIFYYPICLVVIAISYGLYRYWRARVIADLREGAKFDFETFERNDPQLIAGLSFDDFEKIYQRTYLPFFPRAVVIIITIFLLGLPFVFLGLGALVLLADTMGLIPESQAVAMELYLGSDETSIVQRVSPEALSLILEGWAGFYYFFGILIFWCAIAYFVLRYYYRREPGSLREEILRAR